MSATLSLHAGAVPATLLDLRKLPAPQPLGNRHRPIAHAVVATEITRQLGENGFETVAENFGVFKDGSRAFGVHELRSPQLATIDGLYSVCLGWRNSDDQSMSLRIGVGSRVFVCDNMAFSAEYQARRRHVGDVASVLRNIVEQGIARLGIAATVQRNRVLAYQSAVCADRDAAYAIMQAVSQDALPARHAEDVWDQWRKPNHPEFLERNHWSLFNSFTEVYKTVAQADRRSLLLTQLVDKQVSFDRQAAAVAV